jgi:hypothetical protein
MLNPLLVIVGDFSFFCSFSFFVVWNLHFFSISLLKTHAMEKEYKGFIVNSNGTVWKNGKEIGNKPNANGYCTVSVKARKRSKTVGRYRLIWEAFNGKIPIGFEIDHINRVRNDDRLENLRCVTHKENMNNPSTISYIISKKEFGRSFFGNKAKEVEQYKGCLLNKTYKSIHHACVENGISSFDVHDSDKTSLIVNGFTYKIKP